MRNKTSGGSLRGRRICIIGAGIGGLTAALAFARRGAVVEVFEQAGEIKEVGAGIQITPNGARALEALGCGEAMAQTGIAAQAVMPVDALTGFAVTRFDLTAQSPAYRFFHRASLIGLLARAAQAAGAKVYLGVRVTSVAPDGTLTTTNGVFPSDLCVGADGIHSIARSFVGPAPEAVFTGQVAWRGVMKAKGVAPEAQIWMAPKRHVVIYPLAEDMVNVVAVQERTDWAEEGWNHPDDGANLQAAFADCAPALRDVLRHINRPLIWGLFRHPVAERWFSNRIAILGDAAHPTLPFLAQGANLAIEDAYVLARCVDEVPDLGAALARFQTERRPRVTRAIDAANANATNYHLSGVKRTVAHIGLKILGKVAPNAFLNRLDWLYGHDVTQD